MGTFPLPPSPRVGRLLRERRIALGWSLRQVEARARTEAGERIPPSTLLRIEQGKLDPGVRRLHLLIRLYDIPSELVSDLVEIESQAIEPEAGIDLETLMRDGERLWKEGQVPSAIGHALALRERAVASPEERRLRQRATLQFATYARNLGKLKLAKRLLEDLFAEPPEADAAIDAFVLGASVWRHLGMPDVAIAMIREASRRVGPDDLRHAATVPHQEAKILVEAGRAEEAAQAFDRALEAYGRAPDTFASFNADRARVLRVAVLEKLGKPEAALEAARLALESSESHGHGLVALFARIELGRMLTLVGRTDEAVGELEKAEAEARFRNDRNAEFHVRFALWKTYLSRGESERAAAELERSKGLLDAVDARSKEAEEILGAVASRR